MNAVEVGELIRQKRETENISRPVLAERAHTSPDTLKRLEKGNSIRTATLFAVCGALGLRITITEGQG